LEADCGSGLGYNGIGRPRVCKTNYTDRERYPSGLLAEDILDSQDVEMGGM
jgi:hypothetical protein